MSKLEEPSHQGRSADMRSASILLIAVTICFWSSVYLYVPILSPYAEQMGASMGMLGIIVGSYGFSQLVLRIPTGILSDRIGQRKPFILIGFLAAIGAGLGLAFSSGPLGILASRTLSGVAATMWVVISVLFSSYFPADRAGYAMGLITFSTTVSQLSSTLLGGLMAEAWGWHAPFWAAVVVGALGCLLAAAVKEVKTRNMGVALSELIVVGRERSLLVVSGLAALFQFTSFVTVYGFTPNYAVELGASKAELGWLSLVSTLPTALASLGTGSLFARWFNEKQMVTVGFALSAAATVVIPVVGTLEGLYITQAIGGFGRGLIFPVLMALSIQTVPGEKRATAMGFFQSIYALGMFAGPAVSGVAAGYLGLNGAFYTAAVVSGLGTVLSWTVLSQVVAGARGQDATISS